MKVRRAVFVGVRLGTACAGVGFGLHHASLHDLIFTRISEEFMVGRCYSYYIR